MIKNIIIALVGLSLVAVGLVAGLMWFTFRIWVPEDKCAVLIRKSGKPLPQGQLVATEPGQMGIQHEVLGPGRYFYNPITWDYEIQPLTEIPAGNPGTWDWGHVSAAGTRASSIAKVSDFRGQFPMVGVVTRKVGSKPGTGQVIVSRASGMQGILEEVLTPGTYRINPYVYDVTMHPAVVIPAGFVGVVTNLFGSDTGFDPADSADTGNGVNRAEDADTQLAANSQATIGQQALDSPDADYASKVRPLAEAGQRGTLRDVLQPGIYFINPKLQKVTLVEIGFNEYSQTKLSETENYRISFPSDTGYLIRVGVTVVWGIHPSHAAEIINEFGNIDGVLDKIIGPQLRSICRNIGSTYAARDFIQGEKRENFQRALTAELQRICRAKNIDVRIALVREIEVHAPDAQGGEVTEDLKRTIQQSYIAIESQLTKDKQRDAATVRAALEEEKKKVDIAREMIRAESRVLVANVLAEGEKQAAEIDAQADLDVATIQQEVAQFEAKRVETLGQAKAAVERMKNEAEAKGYELLINAFGSGHAYNLYTFAEHFEPQSIQLFFAGEGTFWTDLSRFGDLGAARLLETSGPPGKAGKPAAPPPQAPVRPGSP